MEVLLLGIYSFVVWLVFIKFKWLPWTTPWKVAVFIFPVIAIAVLLLLLAWLWPRIRPEQAPVAGSPAGQSC